MGRTKSNAWGKNHLWARNRKVLSLSGLDEPRIHSPLGSGASKWQFFEQYSHEPYIAVARFIAKYLGLPEERRAEYEAKQEGGYKALCVMEQQLSKSDFLVNGSLTIADISLYAYTHVADEGGFDLSEYPAVRAWLDRISIHPRHLTLS